MWTGNYGLIVAVLAVYALCVTSVRNKLPFLTHITLESQALSFSSLLVSSLEALLP